MVNRKKTFPGYDYALCDAVLCPKCNNCVRHLTHLKAIEDNYDTWGQTYLVVEPKDYTLCDAYVDGDMWANRYNLENTEYDYGHNVNYTSNDSED